MGTSLRGAVVPNMVAASQLPAAPSVEVVTRRGRTVVLSDMMAEEAKSTSIYPVLAAVSAAAVSWGALRKLRLTRGGLLQGSRARAQAVQRIARRYQGGVEGIRVLEIKAKAKPLSQICMTNLSEGVVSMCGIVDPADAELSEEFELGKGSTDNCYLLHGGTGSIDEDDGPIVLVDVLNVRYEEAFLEKMKPYLQRLEDIVFTTLDSEHLAALPDLCAARDAAGAKGKLRVHCSEPAAALLAEDPVLKDLNFTVHQVGNGDFISVPPAKSGARPGHQRLRAVTCPTPRFAEAIAAFDERNGFIYSGKFFSAHIKVQDMTEDPVWREVAQDWAHLKDHYFFTETALKAMNQIFLYAGDTDLEDGFDPEEPDILALAPMHGPIVRREAWRLMTKYTCWLQRKLKAKDSASGNVVIVHTSAYGNTKAMADAVARGIEEGGLQVTLLNLEFTDASAVESALRQADGFAVGSPTLGGQMPIQVKEAVGVMLRVAQETPNMPCGVFGSYGWSGEAPGEIHLRLMDAGFKSAFDPITVKMKPKPKDVKVCEEAGVRLAQKILENKDAARKKKLRRQLEAAEQRSATIGGQSVESTGKAFGRIVNSSCMLTFHLEDKDLIRLPVSWISQASFEPPGLMIAVQQDEIDKMIFQPLDDQLSALFQKYDTDGSGALDKEEAMLMLDELFGLDAGQARGPGFEAKKEEAWRTLDEDGSGTVDTEEFRNEAENGSLAEQIAKQRRLTALEVLVGTKGNNLDFTVSVLPSGMSRSEAMECGLAKKAKVTNDCGVIDGAVAFLECQASQAMQTGSCMLLYCEVKTGKVLVDTGKAEILDEEGRHVAASEEDVPAAEKAEVAPVVEEKSEAEVAPAVEEKSEPPAKKDAPAAGKAEVAPAVEKKSEPPADKEAHSASKEGHSVKEVEKKALKKPQDGSKDLTGLLCQGSC